MSSSTIALKNSSPAYPDSILKHQHLVQDYKAPALLLISLWLFASIFSAAKIDLSTNVTGIAISFNMQDVVVTILTSWLLHRGFVDRSITQILPWIIVSVYGLYYNHYRNLTKMASVLRHVRHSTALPWIAIFISACGVVLKLLLTLRIAQLMANLWYRKKLEKEIYDSVH